RHNFKCELDYTKIIDSLGDDYVIILKLHPIVDEKSVVIPDEYKDKVLNLTRYKEINDLLIITDILITDYSSVVFEYALLDRPMIMFAYDLDSYINERNFYYEYKDFVPGPIVYTNEQIIDLVKDNSFDLEKVKEFKHKFFEDVDGKATKRIVEYLIKNAK
ncbi:MAG: CDP-glycerol glycerophosphotransferase family protein, partial [Peptostreptococcaceae bacterium]